MLANFRGLNIKHKEERIKKLFDELQDLFPNTNVDQKRHKIPELFRFLKVLSKILLSFSLFVLTVFASVPFFMKFYSLLTSNDIKMAMFYTIQWRPENNALFFLIYLQQIVYSLTGLIFLNRNDTLYCICFELICKLYEVIAHDLRNLKNQHELGILIENHEKLLELTSKFDEVFCVGNLLNILLSILAMSVGLIQVLATESFEMKIKYAVCFLVLIPQVFILSFWGDKVEKASESIAKAAYDRWKIEDDKKMKTSLQLILIRSQRPQRLTGYKFIKLSCGTFTAVIKTAYSYYTLLMTVHEND
ncbi:CLUMA_CG010541, isoform A [Clunio marinus]|uniref:CLUMA_CG010541, isoform A n=1 Tax=Clunio marinus TaxID=568069 RepID=A0A1J1IA61_9DIPT|nr:CLUMA_CG010541, isoform A [Clunio marinus]